MSEAAPVLAGPLREYLDQQGLGSGEPRIEPIGDGHSNLTFLVERDGACMVLRRPPHGPLPPSAHDVLREAGLLRSLRPHGVPVPEVLAICDDEAVIGAPFYLMNFVDGLILTASMPEALAGQGEAIAARLVDGLAELHARLGPALLEAEALPIGEPRHDWRVSRRSDGHVTVRDPDHETCMEMLRFAIKTLRIHASPP